MPRHRIALKIALILVLGAAPALAGAAGPTEPAAGPFALRDGDRVVFYGDSITQEGGYGRLVEAFVVSRHPDWDVRFFNSGVGGDRVSGGSAGTIDVRLERDVIALRPTVVTLMLGMNDAGYTPYDPATFAAYTNGFKSIVRRLKEALPEVRLFLILPSPFDDVTRPPLFPAGYDDVLRRYGCYVEALAKREGAGVVDFRTPLNTGLAAVQAENPELARQLLPDRVHPSDAGQLVMGAALLRAWNAPTLVSRVEIAAGEPRLAAAERTAVTDLQAGDDGLSWTQLDESLPLPLNFGGATAELAEAAGAGLEELNQQPLVVTGLAAGRYGLRIDDTEIGDFTDTELAAGVNLQTFNTPMRWQAFSIVWGAAARHELRRVQRQLLRAESDPAAWQTTVDRLEAFDEAMQARRSERARPLPRRYRITPR